MIIFIDGENFRHQLAKFLVDHGLIKNKNEFFKFKTRKFLEDITKNKEIEIKYYATTIKQPYQSIPKKLEKSIDFINKSSRSWIAALNNQNIQIIKAGHIRVRESNSCVHCGKKTLVLQEKGVDVKVATDLLQTKHGQHIILLSSDSDLCPALAQAKENGIKITYMCYSGSVNGAIVKQVAKTLTFDDNDILDNFGGKK